MVSSFVGHDESQDVTAKSAGYPLSCMVEDHRSEDFVISQASITQELVDDVLGEWLTLWRVDQAHMRGAHSHEVPHLHVAALGNEPGDQATLRKS